MSDAKEPIEMLRTPIELEYTYSAGQSASRFLRGIAKGKLLGQKCPVDGRVYFPSRGSCPQHGMPFRGDTVCIALRRFPIPRMKELMSGLCLRHVSSLIATRIFISLSI